MALARTQTIRFHDALGGVVGLPAQGYSPVVRMASYVQTLWHFAIYSSGVYYDIDVVAVKGRKL